MPTYQLFSNCMQDEPLSASVERVFATMRILSSLSRLSAFSAFALALSALPVTARADVVARVSLSTQEMTVYVDGVPRYLFLDEPTASLDLRHQLLTLDTARNFARAGGGVIAILHDLNLAALYADKIIVVSAGRIAASGTPRDVLTDAMMRAVFGVSVHVGGVPTDAPFILPHTAHAA